MKTREVEYLGQKSLLIFFMNEERAVYEAMLPLWNHTFENIVSYISGDRDVKEALKQIVSTHAS